MAQSIQSPAKTDWFGLLLASFAIIPLLVGPCLLAYQRHVKEERQRIVNERYASHIAEVLDRVSVVIERATHRQSPDYSEGAMAPIKVWTGRGATVVRVSHGEDTLSRQRPQHVFALLARAPGGQFFEVRYQLPRDCVSRALECLRQENFQPLSSRDVEQLLFFWNEPVLYRRLFGKTMPPKEVPVGQPATLATHEGA